MSTITATIAFVMSLIAGTIMYEMYEATKFVLVISLIGTVLIVSLAIAAHRSRKSYIRFSPIELLFIFIGTFLSLSMVQNIVILILN